MRSWTPLTNAKYVFRFHGLRCKFYFFWNNLAGSAVLQMRMEAISLRGTLQERTPAMEHLNVTISVRDLQLQVSVVIGCILWKMTILLFLLFQFLSVLLILCTHLILDGDTVTDAQPPTKRINTEATTSATTTSEIINGLQVSWVNIYETKYTQLTNYVRYISILDEKYFWNTRLIRATGYFDITKQSALWSILNETFLV